MTTVTPDAASTRQPTNSAPVVETTGSQPTDYIGRAGEPVRVISFASGGFDTAIQLGVIHALLVIQGKAPDAVVGVSAGAINAVALAEILQAGPHPKDRKLETREDRLAYERERREARVARFREILDAYQQAPGEIMDALLPDTFQVGAQRALQPIVLPIHDQQEREERRRAAESRTGLINLYNELLSLRISFGTLTRAFRRYLGIQAAGEIRSRAGRVAVWLVEFARTWFLVGSNLHRLIRLVPTFLAPIFRRKQLLDPGHTAGAIIFRPRWLLFSRRVVFDTLSAAVLYGVWAGITILAVGFPFVLLQLALAILVLFNVIGGVGGPAISFILDHRLEILVSIYGVALLIGAALLWGRPWRELTEFNKATGRQLLGTVLMEAGGTLLLLALWTFVLIVGLTLAGLAFTGIPPRDWTSTLIMDALPLGYNAWWETTTAWLLILGLTVWMLWRMGRLTNYRRHLLAQYGLADSLFSPHPVREFFVRLFDLIYYGKTSTDEIVARALDDESKPSRSCSGGKLIQDYAAADPPIRVGLTVADVKTGALECVPPDVKVVNGLLAATAVVPFFPPQMVGEKLYIDGANIALEPTESILQMLRDRVHPEATVAHIYAVSPLPFSQSSLRKPNQATADGNGKPGNQAAATPVPEQQEYLNLMDVAIRALQLQRYRDSNMERRMTELYTRVIPRGTAKYSIGPDGSFVRAWVVPVEPESPIELNRQLFSASDKVERRQRLAEAVADGCRAALQVMVHGKGQTTCRLAVKDHLERTTVPEEAAKVTLPGSHPDGGPGLVEVCRHCALHRQTTNGTTPPNSRQTLEFRNWKDRAPAWPQLQEKIISAGARDPRFYAADDQPGGRGSGGLQALPEPDDPAAGWPRDGKTIKGNARPLVSLLFSGGVFRGVYQVGVLNALSEVNVTPDIVAGASVGSITAAMVCQSLRQQAGRRASIARMAGTYLALDRLVLTDRFADFVRNLTLRAAETRFSMHQADRMFRRFDSASSARFSREARLVTAGLERLFYISPFELLKLVEAFRDKHRGQVSHLIQRHLQEWLDRMGVGNEILGTEPLARLITGHAMSPEEAEKPSSVPFHTYLRDESRIFFLATVTNLTQGSLEILGLHYLDGSQKRAGLLQGLLASSAFPAVFRPRWSREVMPFTNTSDQYIDGGTMDNLPLDAVAQFLYKASQEPINKVEPRPLIGSLEVPHLLFSASLEVDPPRLTTRDALARYESDWPALWRRARRLGYNRKLKIYEDTQRNLSRIYEKAREDGQPTGWKPLNLEVVVARPQWLCGTFAFHPMLGFRRARQAASIAHGCATTLVALGRVKKNPDTQPFLKHWGVDEEALPEAGTIPAGGAMPLPEGDARAVEKGQCWLRPRPCPFSAGELKALQLPRAMETSLGEIHRTCHQPRTHMPD